MPIHNFKLTQKVLGLLSAGPWPESTSFTSCFPGGLREFFQPTNKTFFKVFLCCVILLVSTLSYGADKLVIARNGAGDALIENSLAAIVLAASQKVQILEVPVNMSKDRELILFKDLTLNRMTDAAKLFPEKVRDNGSFYVIDFTLAELRQLRMKNVFENDPNQLSFTIPTLAETLSLIQRLEDIFDYSIGITIEPVAPQYYLENTYDISNSIVETLITFGYLKTQDNLIFLQSSDSDELQRIHTSILPSHQVTIPLIQLVKEVDEEVIDTDGFDDKQRFEQEWLFTNIGLRHIVSYADAIALPDSLLFSPDGKVLRQRYLKNIKKYGLKILISSTDHLQALPMYTGNVPALLNLYYDKALADGIYTNDYLSAQKHNTAIKEQAKRRAELPEFFSNLNLTLPPPKQENPILPTYSKDNFEE